MHFPQPVGRTQIPLFDAFLGTPEVLPVPGLTAVSEREESQCLSELSLSAARGSRLQLLGAILRDLSQLDDHRWLCLVGSPAGVTHEWLRRAGIHRERVLLLQPGTGRAALELACEALRLGRSHTVVSWLSLQQDARQCLLDAAVKGRSQSLNIVLG